MFDPDRTLRTSDISALAKRLAMIARLMAKELQAHEAKKYDDLANALTDFSDAADSEIAFDPAGTDLPVIIDGDYVRIGSSKYENLHFSEEFSGILLTKQLIKAIHRMGKVL